MHLLPLIPRPFLPRKTAEGAEKSFVPRPACVGEVWLNAVEQGEGQIRLRSS
jgi:hypothetical protein